MKLAPIWTMNFRLRFPSTKVFEIDMGLGEPEPEEAAEPEVREVESETERLPAGFAPNPPTDAPDWEPDALPSELDAQ